MTPKDRPGIERLRAMNARPRLPLVRAVVAAVVAVPKTQPVRKPRKAVPEQGALL